MSDKYIIKNCPAMQYYTCEKYGMCQDCTDCVLKQIVKITKNYYKGCGKHCDINRKHNNCGKTCNAYKIRQILNLLDIQEVE